MNFDNCCKTPLRVQLDYSGLVAMGQHDVANPAPLGLFGFALTTALLQGAVTSITEDNTHFLVYGYAMFFGGLCQLLAGMWEFKRKNTFSAAAFSSYGGFWMSTALIGVCTAAGIFSPMPHDGQKMLMSLWGILTFIYFVGSLSINIALQALFMLLSVVFFLLAGGVSNPASHKAAGWIGLVVAGIAFYAGCADLVNERFQKTLLPLGHVNWVPILLPPFQRAFGRIPILGPIYLRAVAHEDSLAGYGSLEHGSPQPQAANDTVKAVRQGISAGGTPQCQVAKLSQDPAPRSTRIPQVDVTVV